MVDSNLSVCVSSILFTTPRTLSSHNVNEMDDLKQDRSADNFNFGQEGLVVVNTSDQAIRLSAWVNQVPEALLGFYYTSAPDSELKVKLFDLISGNTSPLTKNVIPFSALSELETVISVKVFPLVSDTKEPGVNFRKLVYWLETGLDTYPEAMVKLKSRSEPWHIKSFTELKLDEEFEEEEICPELVLRTIYDGRHVLCMRSFDLPLSPKASNPKLTAQRARNKIIELAEAAYEAGLSESLEAELNNILKRDRSTVAAKDLLKKVNAWLNRGIFLQDEFRQDFSKIFGDTSDTADNPRVITCCERDAATLPTIRTEIKELISGLTSASEPPVINFRNLIKIHNEISHLIGEETLVIDGNGTSWPALVVDSPDSNLVCMTSKLKSHNQLIFSLCRPAISDISKPEAAEVLLYLEGLDTAEQLKYLNIKHALIEYLKTL